MILAFMSLQFADFYRYMIMAIAFYVYPDTPNKKDPISGLANVVTRSFQ